MLKKRIIFTLLYDNGYFVLSRNFRLQRVGNITWLKQNYDFSHISFFIDELIVLDVTRDKKDKEAFCHTLEELTKGCFVPIAAGGQVRSFEYARRLLRSGADKIVVNTPLFNQPKLMNELVKSFGQQCIVGSLDLKRNEENQYKIWIESGTHELNKLAKVNLQNIKDNIVGEWYLNSIDKDGTGQGYDFDLLNIIPKNWTVPIILAGGAGNSSHLVRGLSDSRVDAVATAHLFNFVGDGLKQARLKLLDSNIDLAFWPPVGSLLDQDLSK